jgi:hypothetical protein
MTKSTRRNKKKKTKEKKKKRKKKKILSQNDTRPLFVLVDHEGHEWHNPYKNNAKVDK